MVHSDISDIISKSMTEKMDPVSKRVAMVQSSELFRVIVRLSCAQGAKNNQNILNDTEPAKNHNASAVIL